MILDTLEAIVNGPISDANLRYCLVDKTKKPYKPNNELAKPNNLNDFVELSELLQCDKLESYAGVGISIQASNISAIDVDKCFARPFDITSADSRATELIQKLSPYVYIEFSFSGTGLRVLCQNEIIEDYSDKYYIKNESTKIEYYQPTKSYRYVTVTGKAIQKNIIRRQIPEDILYEFLDKYLKKPIKKEYEVKTEDIIETKTKEQLMKKVKYLYLTNSRFQHLWFDKAPGSGSNESERDFELICYLYENITQDKAKIKELFEESDFFKSKDWKHVKKWENQDFRYYNYIYSNIHRVK